MSKSEIFLRIPIATPMVLTGNFQRKRKNSDTHQSILDFGMHLFKAF